jgi:hypothetical protein
MYHNTMTLVIAAPLRFAPTDTDRQSTHPKVKQEPFTRMEQLQTPTLKSEGDITGWTEAQTFKYYVTARD